MSLTLEIFLGAVILALVLIAATGIPVVLRVRDLRRRSRALEAHPTLIAMRKAQALAETTKGIDVRLARIRERSVEIGEAAADLLATSAVLRLEVDRISFATRLLLETLVPTLRGSMAD